MGAWGFIFAGLAVVGLLLYAGWIAGQSDSRKNYRRGLEAGVEIGKQYPPDATLLTKRLP